MRKETNKNEEYIYMFIEIDPEKKVVCISDKCNGSGGGVAKKYRNKKDISRIIDNYLHYEVSLYPDKNNR